MNNKKLLILLPSFILCSCGYSLKELYDGNAYNSSIFIENYYKERNVLDSSEKLIKRKNITLNENDQKVFTSFDDFNFSQCEPKKEMYEYVNDSRNPDYLPGSQKSPYGASVCLTKYDQSFKYGMISKLFDGQMFCNGYHQLSRIQIEESGFSTLFDKESYKIDYFMLNFKSAVINKDNTDINDSFRLSITLNLDFYCRDNEEYYMQRLVADDVKVMANISDNHYKYTCFGFKFTSDLGLERICGVGVNYNVIKLERLINGSYKEETLEDKTQGLFLYELSFPNSSWH